MGFITDYAMSSQNLAPDGGNDGSMSASKAIGVVTFAAPSSPSFASAASTSGSWPA
jgi:hypothetical protein